MKVCAIRNSFFAFENVNDLSEHLTLIQKCHGCVHILGAPGTISWCAPRSHHSSATTGSSLVPHGSHSQQMCHGWAKHLSWSCPFGWVWIGPIQGTKSIPSLLGLDEFISSSKPTCSPPSSLSHPGELIRVEITFFPPVVLSLTWLLDLGWLLACPCELLHCKIRAVVGQETRDREKVGMGCTGFTIASHVGGVCCGQCETFPWALHLHQYSRLLLYLLQMGCNSFLSSFFGLFIFYFNPSNFCTSCQTIYCITFLLSSDTISSLTHAGRFPPTLLCLFLLQTFTSTWKAGADGMLHPLVCLPGCTPDLLGTRGQSPTCSFPRGQDRDHHILFSTRLAANFS